MFWLSNIPVVIILAIGTKLQTIIAKMAIEIEERHAVVQGIPVVQLGDKHFWFGSLKLVLFLIHFSLFQNAFEIIHFLWIWYEFGLNSCFHENIGFTIGRLVLGVGVLFLCSYITLPLYALVSQMGSHMKKSIFDEQTSKALKKWHMTAKKKQANRSPRGTPGQSPAVSPIASPVHTLQRFQTTGHMGFASSPIFKRSQYLDQELSDRDGDGDASTSQTAVLIVNMDGREGVVTQPVSSEENDEDDFSFVRPAPHFSN